MEELVQEFKDLQRKINDLLRLFVKFRLLKKDGLNNVYRLETTLFQIKERLKKLEDHIAPKLRDNFINWIRIEEEMIQGLKQDLRSKFGNELEDILNKNGFRLHGQYPNLYTGLYLIKIEFERGVASIFWGPEFIKKMKPEPTKIVDSILRFEEGLKGKDWNISDFKERLYEAYKRVIKIDKKVLGDKVPIVSVLNHLSFLMQGKKFLASPTKANFREYSRASFGYDLYRLRQSKEGNRFSLFIATYDTTRSKEKVIFVPDSTYEGGTRYAYLSISE